MSTAATVDLKPVLAKLGHVHGVPENDRAALAALPWHVAEVPTGGTISREGDDPDRCYVVLDGWACSSKATGDGRRQVLCFHVAGDWPDLHGLHLGTADAGVAAITACRVASVSLKGIRKLCARHPHLAAALWRETLFQAVIVREWLLNVGRRDALASVAHLMCEMVVRQSAAGLVLGREYNFPLSQAALADALGLSTVHVNRMVQELRGEGLIRWERSWLEVLDWDRLRVAADFHPAYLHLGPTPHVR